MMTVDKLIAALEKVREEVGGSTLVVVDAGGCWDADSVEVVNDLSSWDYFALVKCS